MKDENKTKDQLINELAEMRQQFKEMKASETRRKQAEEALRATKEGITMLAQTVASMKECVSITNKEHKFIFVNRSFFETYGFNEDEILGKTSNLIFSPNNPKSLRKKIRSATMKGGWKGELLNLKKDVTEFPIELSTSILIDDKGDVIGYMGISTDITERKRTVEELEMSRQLLRTIYDTIPDAVISTDMDFNIVLCNQSVQKILGYTPDELVGKKYLIIVPEETIKDPKRKDRQAELLEKGYLVREDYYFKRKDGEIFPANFSVALIKDKQGKPVGLVGTIRDITERKRAEKVKDSIYRISEAAHSAQNLEELFGSIHHIVGELMPVKNFFIALYDPAGGVLSFPYFVDEYDKTPAPKKPGKGLTEYVLRTGEPLLASPEVFEGLVKKDEVVSIGSPSIDWLGVPLKTEDKAIGVLVVQSYTEGVRFGEVEKDILRFVSDQVAMAIERKRAEEALRRLGWAVESASDAIGMADVAGKSIYHNEAFVELFGYTVDELNTAGGPPAVYTDPDAAREVFDTITRGSSWSGEVEMQTRTGREVVVFLRADCVKDDDGKITGLVGIHTDITERKRAEEKLREREEKYRTLTENINVGVYRNTGPTGKFIEGNPAIVKMFGYDSREEFLSINVADLYQNSEDRKKFNEKMLKDGFVRSEELRLKKKDETFFIGSVSVVAVKDEKGKVKYYDGIIEDITERKRAEEELRAAKEYASNLIDSSLDMIISVDKERRIVGFNRAAQEAFGYSKEEVFGKPIDILYADPAEGLKAHKTTRRRGRFIAEIMNKRKNGELFPSFLSASILRDENGEFLGVMGVSRDITERKRAEEELRAAKEYASNLIESSLDMIISVDKDRRIVEFNRAAQIAFGYHKDEVLGKHVDILYADPEEGLKAHNTARRTGRFTGEIMSKRKNGKLFPSLLSASILLEINGEFQGVMGVSRDITELKSLEQRQRELEFELLKQHRLSSIGLLASGVAHNINNPLAVVLGRAQLLYRKMPDLKGLDIIIAQAKRIETIVDNMKIKSRREQETHKGPLDLNELLTTELGFLEADLDFKHQIQKDYQFQEGLPPIEGVYSDFSQGLLNIIRNAIDAMYESEEKKLTVRTRYDEDFVYVEISDIGCGIAEGDIPKLFSPFFSTKPTTEDREFGQPRGTGLGLYSTYQLLQSYGVKFYVQSKVGKGTTFTVKIPQTSDQLSFTSHQ
ncbi:PAS domain S-box protein [candidate division KSB1 bacterium]|nr:PAS domain S-box protein [candidate division KSB1 bacterium]